MKIAARRKGGGIQAKRQNVRPIVEVAQTPLRGGKVALGSLDLARGETDSATSGIRVTTLIEA